MAYPLPEGTRLLRRFDGGHGFTVWYFGQGIIFEDFRISVTPEETPKAYRQCEYPSRGLWIAIDELLPPLLALLPPEELAVLAAARIGVAYEPAA